MLADFRKESAEIQRVDLGEKYLQLRQQKLTATLMSRHRKNRLALVRTVSR